MSAHVVHSAPRRARKALTIARTMTTTGILMLLAGLVFIWIGPVGVGVDTAFFLVTALVVIGITVLLLAPVVYFSYMELLEPEIYSPAHATWHLEE